MQTSTLERAAPFLGKFARMLSAMGMPPMLGKTMGYLLISEPAAQTRQEIARALKESPESVAEALEGLVAFQLVTRIDRPDDPEACFAMSSLNEIMAKRTKYLSDARAILDEGLQSLKDEPAETRARLAEWRDLYATMETELPAWLARSKQGRKGSNT